MTITAEMVKKAMSDKSEYNQYAGCAKDEYYLAFKTDSPETFDLVPFWTKLPEYVEHCDLTDFDEEVGNEWVPATIDGIECFVRISHEGIAFMDVPADMSEINWIRY